VILPVAEFMPDQSPLAGGSAIVQGVVPISKTAYGPLPQFATPSGVTLGPVQPQGACAGEDLSTATMIIVAGVISPPALYWSADGGVTWSHTSLPPGGWAGYFFTQFKNTMVATSGAGMPAYLFDLAARTGWVVCATGSSVPGGAYCASIAGFLMLGNTWDYTGGGSGVHTPYRVWWSGLGDPTNWPTPGSASAQAAQADYNDFLADYGVITGLTGALSYADGAVFFERALMRVVYSGPPTVFQFSRIAGAKGCRHPSSIVRVGTLAYYYGEDGFYATDGVQAWPIGVGRVDEWFPPTTKLPPSTYTNFVLGAYDATTRCIFWRGPPVSTNGGVDYVCTFAVYSVPFDKWSSFTITYVYNTYGDYIFQGLSLTGGSPENNFIPALMAFSNGGQFSSNSLLETLSGPPMEAFVSTKEGEMFPGQMGWVRGVRPLTDGDALGVQVSIHTRNNLTDVQIANPPTNMNSMGVCPQRISARYASAVVRQPASTIWNFIEGVDVDAIPAGWR
jgi:hypothetical protein